MADRQRVQTKLGARLLLVLLVATLVPSWSYSQVGGVELSVKDLTGAIGSVVFLEVKLGDGSGMSGLQFDVVFDPAVLSFSEELPAIAGPLSEGDRTIVVSDGSTPGTVSVAVVSVDGFKEGAGIVALIPMEINPLATPGSAALLPIINAFASGPTGLGIPLETGMEIGVLFIGGPCVGDANLDNVQGVADAVLILNVIVRKQSLVGQALINADVNEDALITVEDVVLLLNHIVGKVPLPFCS